MPELPNVAALPDGTPAEVTGIVATVRPAVTLAGRTRAQVTLRGLDLTLTIPPLAHDLLWRDLQPGRRLAVSGRLDKRRPTLAIAVSGPANPEVPHA